MRHTLVAYSSHRRHTIIARDVHRRRIAFHSIPFHRIPSYSIAFHSILFHRIPFHSIPFHAITGAAPLTKDQAAGKIQSQYRQKSGSQAAHAKRAASRGGGK